MNKSNRLLFVAIAALIFLGPLELRATCSGDTVRLDSSGGSMENTQIIDQGDLGICYACVAAQAAAVHHDVPNMCPLAVAADMAVRHRDQMTDDNNALEDSMVCRAVNAANRAGYCRDCGDFYNALKTANGGGNEFFDSLNRYFNSFRETVGSGASSPNWGDLLTAERVLEFNTHVCTSTPQAVIRRSLVLPTRDVLLRALQQNNPGLVFQNFIQNSCNPRNPPAGGTRPRCRDTEWPTRTAARNLLRGHFTSNEVAPLGMEYCSSVFDVQTPEDFSSLQPEPGVGAMSEFSSYNERRDRVRWLLNQYNRRYGAKLDEHVTRLDAESTDESVSEEERARRRKVYDYVKEIRDCSSSYITYLRGRRGTSAVINLLMDGNNSVDAPMATIVGKVIRERCEESITEKREALPDNSYANDARAALTDDLREQSTYGQKERECKGHASLIVGRRCHNGQHQYLIKNTWGQSCDSYSHDSGTSDSECEASTSSIWLNEDVVINNTYRYNRFN